MKVALTDKSVRTIFFSIKSTYLFVRITITKVLLIKGNKNEFLKK